MHRTFFEYNDDVVYYNGNVTHNIGDVTHAGGNVAHNNGIVRILNGNSENEKYPAGTVIEFSVNLYYKK